ncbi:MAG TPA: hypothetical protein VFD05_02065 [Bacilli bacterium]|nr:hypothetical protein [Bacilli bacterium]
MSRNEALINFLNLASRSKKLRYGQAYLQEKNSHKIKLIILLSNASLNTAKLVRNYAAHYTIKLSEINETEISRFVTKQNIKVISVLDVNIARKLLNLRKEGKLYEKDEAN